LQFPKKENEKGHSKIERPQFHFRLQDCLFRQEDIGFAGKRFFQSNLFIVVVLSNYYISFSSPFRARHAAARSGEQISTVSLQHHVNF
jgi:hypothetical protein